jgi:hypothetical protein
MLLQGSTEDLVCTTKRLIIVLEQPTTPMPPSPPGTIFTRRRGREATCTLRPCTPDAVARLRQSPGVLDVTVQDLSLDEIFKDLVRGQDPSRNDALPTTIAPLAKQETAA